MEIVATGILSISMTIAYNMAKKMEMETSHKVLVVIALIGSFLLLFLTSAIACCTIT